MIFLSPFFTPMSIAIISFPHFSLDHLICSYPSLPTRHAFFSSALNFLPTCFPLSPSLLLHFFTHPSAPTLHGIKHFLHSTLPPVLSFCTMLAFLASPFFLPYPNLSVPVLGVNPLSLSSPSSSLPHFSFFSASSYHNPQVSDWSLKHCCLSYMS